MSYLNLGLLVAFIAIFVWSIWEDKRKWDTVYEADGSRSEKVQQRLKYLQTKGIHCRLKNDLGGSIRSMGMKGMQMSKQLRVQLQVHKKETDKAFGYLADFNK